MKLAAAVFLLVFVAFACERNDELVPIGIALLVAFVALSLIARQLRAPPPGEPANDNAKPRRPS